MNTNPMWPEGYVATLREAGAQEKTIPFLVTWVRRFFALFPERSRRTLGRGEIEAFLSEMTGRNNISNWQIAQARDALELYYEQFRGIALAPRPDHVLPSTPSPTSAQPSRDQGMTPAVDGQFVATPIVKLLEPYQAPRAPVNAVSRQPVLRQPGNSNTGPRREPDDTEVVPPSLKTKARSDLGRALAPVSNAEGPRSQPSGPITGMARTNWTLLAARIRETLRVAHYSYRTEQTYLGWIRQFVAYHQGRKPSTMDANHVRDFLRHLAMDRQVASSTQNQALNAVVFLFKSVLKKDIGDFSDFQRARRGFRLPVGACPAASCR